METILQFQQHGRLFFQRQTEQVPKPSSRSCSCLSSLRPLTDAQHGEPH
jgi:hypothetical protein